MVNVGEDNPQDTRRRLRRDQPESPSTTAGLVRLWNLADPTNPTLLGQPLTGHTNAIDGVAFSPHGQTLATASSDRTVRLWELDVDHVIERICATAANNLTPARWRQYVSSDLPYQPPCP